MRARAQRLRNHRRFHRSLRITMLVPFAPGDTGSSSITLDTTGCEPREVHRGIGLRQAIRQAETIHIHLDGKKLSTLRIDEYPDEIDDSELRTTADIARDLDIVQDRTGSIFAMPTEISGLERIWLRILRIILDGGIAPIPRTTLNGHTHPGGEINPELCASLAVFHNATVQLFDRPLQLRAPLAYFHPKTSIQALGARDSAGSIPSKRQAPTTPSSSPTRKRRQNDHRDNTLGTLRNRRTTSPKTQSEKRGSDAHPAVTTVTNALRSAVPQLLDAEH
ncbi:hypothetical protein GCM10020255_005190 [Rhodococcus baikonurensis]